MIQYWQDTTSNSEIGSDFSFGKFLFNYYHNNYYHNYQVLYTARSCIKAMIKHTSGEYLLPDYMCNSILVQFRNQQHSFYKLNDCLQIEIEPLLAQLNTKKYNTIYMIDYFGRVDDNIDIIIENCRKYNITIVEDFTHRPFDIDTLYGDITICSIRKTVAVPYGGLISGIPHIKNIHYYSYYSLYIAKMIGMLLKNLAWLKILWRPILLKCEARLDRLLPIYTTDYITTKLLKKFNFERIKQQRIENHQYLHKYLNSHAFSTINNNYFCFPMMFNNTEDRNKVRQLLITKRVYPSILWAEANNISSKMLSIPIDQRYTITDMKRIVSIIKKVF